MKDQDKQESKMTTKTNVIIGIITVTFILSTFMMFGRAFMSKVNANDNSDLLRADVMSSLQTRYGITDIKSTTCKNANRCNITFTDKQGKKDKGVLASSSDFIKNANEITLYTYDANGTLVKR